MKTKFWIILMTLLLTLSLLPASTLYTENIDQDTNDNKVISEITEDGHDHIEMKVIETGQTEDLIKEDPLEEESNTLEDPEKETQSNTELDSIDSNKTEVPESTDELSKALDNSLEDQEHLSLSEDTPSPANITPCGIAPVGYEVNCVSTEAQFTAAIKKKDNVYIGLTANIQVRSSIDNKYQPGLLAPLTKANYVIEGNGFSLIGPNNTDSGLIDHFSLLGITESGLQTYSFQNITLIGTSKGGIINIPKSHPQSFFSFKNVVFKGLHVLSVSHSPVILEDSEFHLLSSADVKALPEYQSFTATIKTADAVTLFTAPEVQIRNQVRLESDVLSKADLMRTEKLTVSANANLKVKANGVIKTDLVQGFGVSVIDYQNNGSGAVFQPASGTFTIRNTDLNLIPTSLQFRLPTLTTGAKQVIADQLNYNALDFDVFEFDSIWGRPKMTTATRIEDLQVSVVNSNINLKVGIVPNALLTESKIEVQSSNINFEVGKMDKHIIVATEASFLNSKVNILIKNEEAEDAPIKSVVNLRHKFSNLYSVVDIGLVNTMNFYIKANTGTIKEEFFRVTSNSKVDLISYDIALLPKGLIPIFQNASYNVIIEDQQIHNYTDGLGDRHRLVSQFGNDITSDKSITPDNAQSDYDYDENVAFVAKIDVNGNLLTAIGSVVGNLLCFIGLGGDNCIKGEELYTFDDLLMKNFDKLEIAAVANDNIRVENAKLTGKTDRNAKLKVADLSTLDEPSFSWDNLNEYTSSSTDGSFNIGFDDLPYGNLVLRIKDGDLLRYVKFENKEAERIYIHDAPMMIDFGSYKVNDKGIISTYNQEDFIVRDTRDARLGWTVEVIMPSKIKNSKGHIIDATLKLGSCDLNTLSKCTLSAGDFTWNAAKKSYTLSHRLILGVKDTGVRYVGDYNFDLNWKLLEQ